MPPLKIKPYPGVTYIAQETIEAQRTEIELRNAQHEFETRLHDLHSEFLARKNELRQLYLRRVAEIAG